MIKLIATDMDGTWLKNDKTYDKKLFAQAFKLMQDHDVKFVIASGNQYENIFSRFPETQDKMYFVAENGSLVAHGHQILRVDDLGDDLYHTLLGIVNEYGYPTAVSGLTSAYLLKSADPDWIEENHKYYSKIKTVDNFEDINDRIFKVSIVTGKADMPKVMSELRSKYSQFSFVSGSENTIDISSRGMNKAVGLQHLGEKLNINPSEMVAFGDSGNDAGMLKYAGRSYAMSTALPEAKKAASEIIGSSEDSSVQKKIIELLSD
ncbi:Cof subfamily protein (haloacid dehalogenase superfamily) [Lactobacillus colini]|uniref:Cof subfamily protein (Haloacid dehalogenase superfamily) n=1 Tax=Lactobacillus colini TaxID=1819254 RepID=A0ABS4MEP3_9LACO|nr:HAD family hydrolase [Lactobacillus colini]MBP2058136.1 Cof subfamily protein (haloacid dehalogenase superfamily) [Lactobacillus colini]